MYMTKELNEFLEDRNHLLRNPTLEAAQNYWLRNNLGQWARPDVPLAAAHKARLQWLESTDEMLAESIKWLEDNDYKIEWFDAPPLTPEKRDADRITLGKKPLGKS
jgi:hypothetical protein